MTFWRGMLLLWIGGWMALFGLYIGLHLAGHVDLAANATVGAGMAWFVLGCLMALLAGEGL